MSDVNLNKDTRDRGLEVLLYQIKREEDDLLQSPVEHNQRKCKLTINLPLLFGREFHFHIEFYITNHLNFRR